LGSALFVSPKYLEDERRLGPTIDWAAMKLEYLMKKRGENGIKKMDGDIRYV